MKTLFTLILALMIMPLQTYAGSNAHDLHKQPFSGSSNRIITPLAKLEQQELSKANPIGDSGYDVKLMERVSWVKVNTAAIDALRSYAIEVLEQAENNTDLNVSSYRNYEGENLSVRVKQPLEFPLDINLSFFDDIQFNDLFLGEVTKATTKDGKIYYSLVIKQRNTSLPAIYVELRDKLTIYAGSWKSDIRLEQVGKSNFRVYQQKRPVLIEEQVNSTIKKTEQLAARHMGPSNTVNNSAATLNSTQRIIDVLVLFDNHSDQSSGKSVTVLPGLRQINEVLANSNVNARLNIIAYDKLPTTICGGGATACYSSYGSHLSAITASKDILKLRLKYGADVTVVIRSTPYGDLNYQTAGIANLTIPSDPLQANKTFALIHYQSGGGTFAHEIGHILGAGHSAYNSAPGSAPARAYLGFYDDNKVAPYHKDAVKTLMTYDHICKSELDDINKSNPGKSEQRCVSVEQFSGPVQYAAPWSNTNVMIGSNTVANRYRVDDVSRRAPGWSQEIINHKPVPAINFVSVPGVAGQPHCFNGVGTTDPDGDRITRFYWFVKKRATSGKVTEATYGTKESTFCWTPTTSQLGDYRVYLSVRDEHGEDKIIGKGFHVKHDPDYISAPELYLNKVASYYIKLSWSTPNVGNASYYQVEKKMDSGAFINAATSADTIEVFLQSGLSTRENFFRVRGCTISGKCGAWSNTLHYHPGIRREPAYIR